MNSEYSLQWWRKYTWKNTGITNAFVSKILYKYFKLERAELCLNYPMSQWMALKFTAFTTGKGSLPCQKSMNISGIPE